MIDKWFLNDINKVLSSHNRLVVTDAHGEGKFLMKYLPKTITCLEVGDDDLQEIEARYVAETLHPDDAVIFYTSRKMNKLKFLLEYAETCGCICMDDMEQYIKAQLFAATHKNTELPKADLLMAAKLSHGHDLNWWKGVCDGIIQPLDVKGLLFDLLRHPKETCQSMDTEVWHVFVAEVYALIGKPPTGQPVEVMAQAVMDTIFSGLLSNTLSTILLEVYYQCTDSNSMQKQMNQYISTFNIPKNVNVLKTHPDHCFLTLDQQLFVQLSHTIEDGGFTEKYLCFITERIGSKKSITYKSAWLKDIKTLIEFKNSQLYALNDCMQFAKYYRDTFASLDSAIRHLYMAWLNNEAIIRPYQYLYEQHNKELLNKWFLLVDDYKASQKDLLKQMLSSEGRNAVIVCDGLRLEIAEQIRKSSGIKTKHDMAFSMLPSVTENGMSALFGCPNVELNAQNRYTQLKTEISDVKIIQLEKLNSSITAHHIVLMFGDIDQVGEKKQLAALKDINTYEELLVDKIEELFAMGYNKVYLTTDHGFVITGILDEADKIIVPDGVKAEERFCTSQNLLGDNGLIVRGSKFKDSNYQYYARTDKPFKTKGAYGYAHGGFTPQECIIPIYEFSGDNSQEQLDIEIANKGQLNEVAGAHFTVKLKAGPKDGTLFQQERKLIIHLYQGDKLLTYTPLFTMKAGEITEYEYDMPSTGIIKLVLIDASTKKQLDFCEVKRLDARGLDGLF